MEEVLRNVEQPMKRESALHSDRSSHGTQCVSTRRNGSSSVGTVPILCCKIHMEQTHVCVGNCFRCETWR